MSPTLNPSPQQNQKWGWGAALEESHGLPEPTHLTAMLSWHAAACPAGSALSLHVGAAIVTPECFMHRRHQSL